MISVLNTKENIARINSLKLISETKWSGTTTHDSLDKCLTALNLDSNNSGWYKPSAIKIPGLLGYFMINQDDSIFCEAKIIKESDKLFRIEYMRLSAWNEFENNFNKLIEEN